MTRLKVTDAATSARVPVRALTVAELLAPEMLPTLGVDVTCATIGISRSFGYDLIARGEFPIRTIRVRGKVRVLTADLIRILGLREAA